MELSRPFGIITPTLDGEVLQVLARGDAEFTSGDIHRVLGARSIRGVLNTLNRLTEQGIVTRRPAGRAHLYQLNRNHLAAEFVLGIASLRQSLLQRLAEEVRAWTDPPIVAALFGSGARSNHLATSDIDIFVVRADHVDADGWDALTESLAEHVTQWTGNDCRIISLTYAQAEELPRHDRLLGDIVRYGTVFHGDSAWLSSLVRAGVL
jgi:predicted nucleotidyltransferase